MSLVSTLGYYTKHPKVTAFFGVIAGLAGAVQDVLIEYANFGHYIAATSIALLVLIELLHLAGKDNWLKNTFGNDWPGLGIAATTILAILMAGSYFWSQNNKPEGGVLASNFESVKDFQSAFDAVMNKLDEIGKIQKDVDERTQSIKEDTTTTRKTASEIKQQIDTDPETILKHHGLTLNELGYFNLVSRYDDPYILEKLLPLYKSFGLDLNINANATSMANRLYSQFSNTSLQPFYFMDWTLIEAAVFLGEISLPGISYALQWEAKNGRNLNEYRIKSIMESLSVSNTKLTPCGQYMIVSCFRSHNVRFRLGSDVNKFGMTLAHIAVLGGNLNSLQWVADQGIDLRTRGVSGYTPLSLALEMSNKPIIDWLLSQPQAIPTDKSIEFEIAAFRAFNQFDSAVNSIKYLPYRGDPAEVNYSAIYQQQEALLRTFPQQISEAQNQLSYLSSGVDKAEIKDRLLLQINPLIKHCESIVSKSKEAAKQYQDAQNHQKRYETHGIGSIEGIDSQIVELDKNIKKFKKYIDEYQSELSDIRDKYSKLQQELNKEQTLHDQIQKRRRSINSYTHKNEWSAAFEHEGKISKSIIKLESEISKLKSNINSNERGIKSISTNIEETQSKIEEYRAIRKTIENERPSLMTDMTPLGESLESACLLAGSFIQSI